MSLSSDLYFLFLFWFYLLLFRFVIFTKIVGSIHGAFFYWQLLLIATIWRRLNAGQKYPFSFLCNVLPIDRAVSVRSEEVWTEMDTNCGNCNTAGRRSASGDPQTCSSAVNWQGLVCFWEQLVLSTGTQTQSWHGLYSPGGVWGKTLLNRGRFIKTPFGCREVRYFRFCPCFATLINNGGR